MKTVTLQCQKQSQYQYSPGYPTLYDEYILRDTSTFIDISIASFYSQNEQKALGNLPSPIGRKKATKKKKFLTRAPPGVNPLQPPSKGVNSFHNKKPRPEHWVKVLATN